MSTSTPFHKDLLSTIGNTPLIHLSRLFADYSFNVYGKLEAQNPGGSIKDRTALSIIKKALDDGRLKAGDTVIESSSGNMAIGLAQICKFYNLQLIIVVDPKVNKQNIRIIEAYGAKVDYVERPAPMGGYLTARINRVKELLNEIPNSFWSNQYSNPNNPSAHRQTMKEICNDLDGQLDYLFVSTSTCGTLMGCADYAHSIGIDTKIIGVDAVGSVIFGQAPKDRLLPGHGASRPSRFLKREFVHEAVHITDRDCVEACHQLLDKEAIFCGGSSGGVISAIFKYAPHIPAGSNCAAILCDRGERYLDTIYNPIWIEEKLGMSDLLNSKRA